MLRWLSPFEFHFVLVGETMKSVSKFNLRLWMFVLTQDVFLSLSLTENGRTKSTKSLVESHQLLSGRLSTRWKSHTWWLTLSGVSGGQSKASAITYSVGGVGCKAWGQHANLQKYSVILPCGKCVWVAGQVITFAYIVRWTKTVHISP